MKPFDLGLAKKGHPICTRDGRKARIICWDKESKRGYPIIALVESKGIEFTFSYTTEGLAVKGAKRNHDLMMPIVRHKKFIVLKEEEGKLRIASDVLFHSIEMAKCYKRNCKGATTILKIEWEE